MLFSSIVFIFIFLPVVLFAYYFLLRKNRSLQNLFLFLSSLFFYAWGEPKFVLVMLLSIIVNWLFGLIVGHSRENNQSIKAKAALTLDIIFNLSVIFIFKYLMFTIENINRLFEANLTVPEIALPIGISFFTFQSMSYVIDVYRGNGHYQKSLVNVGLYISFFPQLIAGPIVRYETIANEIAGRRESFEDFSEGCRRFIIGFSKKILIANNVALVADRAFNLASGGSFYASEGLSCSMAWLGITAYTLQIFFDFSGYSDMAIGLGRMFGFHFLENFNYPYISLSVTEFWRRWHISLGTWFRDYLYIPLGGNRTKTASRHLFNIFLVWLCTGIWHGANWTFVFWGLLYFLLLIFEKYFGFDTQDRNKEHHFIKRCYLLLSVMIGWVIFRSNSIGDSIIYIKAMFGYADSMIDSVFLFNIREYWMFIVVGILASTPVVSSLAQKLREKSPFVTDAISSLVLASLFLISLSYLVKSSYNPFIYFNF